MAGVRILLLIWHYPVQPRACNPAPLQL